MFETTINITSMTEEYMMENSTEEPGFTFGVSMVTEKVITIFSMLATTLLFGLLPLKLFSQLRYNNDVRTRMRLRLMICYSSCFAGGVFIGACLLDLLPDVEKQVSEVMKSIKDEYNLDVDYPVAQFIMVLGFLLILLIEQTVLHFQEQWMAELDREPLLSRSRRDSVGSYGSVHNHDHDAVTPIIDQAQHSQEGHSHAHVSHGVFQHSSLRATLLLVALSFHSLFEGLTIGLQDSEAQLISLFVAVLVHKAVMAFSMGLNLAGSAMSTKAIVLSNIVFSVSSPIGTAVGIALANQPSSLPQDICNGILQGIAGGTFLYITFFEVLPHELNTPEKRLWKVAFVIFGYSCICGLLFITH